LPQPREPKAEQSAHCSGDSAGNYTEDGALDRADKRRKDGRQPEIVFLASAESSGSPNLSSFGPNMSLARDLLEHGEREVVLAYFKRCGVFWRSGEDQLKEWTREIQNNVIPDFGANLRY
jgi:hypothetical protein